VQIILEALEGNSYRSEATFRYRNRSLIEKKKQQSDGRCSVCTLRFSERYKGIDKDCLIAHHVSPIGKRKKATRTTLADIDLLCPNCHTVVHTEDPPLAGDELRKRLVVSA
jgi:5-methylcytosine-specific restriction enzyme A